MNKVYILWEYFTDNIPYEEYSTKEMLGVFLDKENAINYFNKKFSEDTKDSVTEFPKDEESYEDEKGEGIILTKVEHNDEMHCFWNTKKGHNTVDKLGEYTMRASNYGQGETFAFFLEEVTPLVVSEDTKIVNNIVATGNVLDGRDPKVKKFLEEPAVPFVNKSGIEIEIK